MQDATRRSQKDRSDAMRALLIRVGRALFVERGFAGTGTPEIVAQAGVTRGALYHHFEDKEALFEAVVRADAQAVAEAIEAADRPELSPVDRLICGGEAFLAAMALPGRTRLLLRDAPAVLGLAELAKIDAETGGGTLAAGLVEAGVEAPEVAQLLSAAYDRAALALGQGEAPEPWLAALDRLVRGVVARQG